MIFILLNERRNNVLLEILQNRGWIRIEELARHFHVSSRTIRYDLDAVDEFLHSNNLPRLVRKQKGGVKFSELLEERNKAIEMLHNLGLYQYVLSSNERVQRILAELLHAKDYMTIGELADCLWVSRGTVNKDLYRVRFWLEARKLELRSITKYGIKLVGQERDIRQAILQLLRENMPVTRLLEWMSAAEPDWGDSHFFGRWLDNIDIIFLQNCIRQLEKELQVVFSDVAFTGLVLYLAVTIHRIRAGRDVVIGQTELEALQNSRAFAIALLTVNLLEEKFQMSIPLDEVAFFTEHILGSNVSSSAVEEQENRMELDALVCTLIASVSRNLGCDLSLDHQLYEGLLEEIRPSLFRAKYGIKLENSFLDEIMTNYTNLFETVKQCTKPLADYIGGRLLDEEIGYLTIHFSAALERMKARETRRPEILVVCATGQGTANLLSSRLQFLFDVKVIGTAPCHQVRQVIQSRHVDLIISTVSMAELSVPCLTVNPLLLPADITLLKEYLAAAKGQVSVLKDVLQVIEKHCTIFDYDRLRDALAAMLNTMPSESVTAHDLPHLRQLLPASNVKLNVIAENWQDAINQAGNVLYEQGYVEAGYSQAMIDVVEEMGPYIVFWKGIALPHAGIDCGVKQAAISFIRLQRAVSFGSAENDPVDMVFALAAVDNSTHVMALLELTKILSDPDKVEQLRNERDARQVAQSIAAWSEPKEGHTPGGLLNE